MRGVQFILKTPENVNFFMFASEPINLVFDELSMNSISAKGPFNGIIRLAYIPRGDDSSGKTLQSSTGLKRLIYHSDVYPVGVDISYDFQRSGSSLPSKSLPSQQYINRASGSASVTFEFETRSMLSDNNNAATKSANARNLLMLALPHHAEVIPKSDVLDNLNFDINYECIKGNLTPVIGSIWTLDEPLYDIQFDGPIKSMDGKLKDLILKQVENDMNQVLPSAEGNVYGYGKQVARLAQLAHIADRLEGKSTKDETFSNSTITSKVSMQLSKYLEAYLSSEISDNLLFDKNLGGLCSKNGLLDKNEDFGNGRYNGKATPIPK